MPLVVGQGLMLWAAFAAFSLAASVTFDRHGPAIGLSMAYLLVNYFLEILGSFWRTWPGPRSTRCSTTSTRVRS